MPSLALLADCDADTRMMYAEYLRQIAYEIDEAEDGREALAKAISRHPTVIVTDTRLPGMSGLELCKLLRNDASTNRIPIIIVTGDALAADVRLAEAAGADAVLIKPCLPERLAEEIRRVVEQSRNLRARGQTVRETIAAQVSRSNELIARSHAKARRVMLTRARQHRDTTNPSTAPPVIVCPACDRPLNYVKSHIGGVNERLREQWDYFECAQGCGTFQYRQRTRKIRRVG